MKKTIIAIMTILVLILANITVVQAATATATLKTSNETVKVGETFTVTLSVSCEDGINGIDCTYSYDEDKLELVSATSKDSATWASLGSGKEITVISNSETQIKNADIYVLTFKVKDGVENGTTANISTTDILVDSDAENNSECTVKALSASITVEAETAGEGAGTEEPGNTTGEGTGTEEPDNTTEEGNGTKEPSNTTEGADKQNSDNKDTTSKPNKDNTVANVSKLPKTGKSEIVLVIAVILIIASVFAYKKYNNYKEI